MIKRAEVTVRSAAVLFFRCEVRIIPVAGKGLVKRTAILRVDRGEAPQRVHGKLTLASMTITAAPKRVGMLNIVYCRSDRQKTVLKVVGEA